MVSPPPPAIKPNRVKHHTTAWSSPWLLKDEVLVQWWRAGSPAGLEEQLFAQPRLLLLSCNLVHGFNKRKNRPMVSRCPHPVLAAAEVGFQESQGRGPGTWGPAPCLILSSTKEPGLQRAWKERADA